MPPGVRRSSREPSTTRKAAEPTALERRNPKDKCSSAVPQSFLNDLDVGQILQEPSKISTPLSAAYLRNSEAAEVSDEPSPARSVMKSVSSFNPAA